MLFKYSYEISGLRSHLPETEDLEFRFDKPRLVIVRLTRGHPDSKNSSEPLGAMCLAETAQEPADGKIASDLDSGLAGPSEGKWPLLKEATPSTIEFIDGIFRVLKDLIERTVAVFRWREGLPEGPHNPYRNPRGYYSKDGEVWCEVSLARSATIRWGIPPSPRTPPSEMCDEVVKLVSAGIEEPPRSPVVQRSVERKGNESKKLIGNWGRSSRSRFEEIDRESRTGGQMASG